MRDAVAIGECMVELGLEGPGRAAIGYAGDTFNTAVYLSRLGLACAYATAVGKGDPFSAGILARMDAEAVDPTLVVEAEGRLPGLYAIQRDAAGERSFFYWRENAPARDYLALADLDALAKAINGARLVYLSAITLAILGEAGRAALLPLLTAARDAGAAVALDTNYRPRLWPDARTANQAVEAVAPLCAYVSAGAAELAAFGSRGESWAAAGAEVVLRGEDRAIAVLTPAGRERFAPPEPVAVVDTTGAGDSFNAAYLAARLRGEPPAQAVAAGRRLAGVVVQHRGAIIPVAAMPADGASASAPV
jgi:2-dehydro-3-deoxygluconokinase